LILAVDQGTTGTTCLVVDDELVVRGRGYVEIQQSYPRPGWVEHDPDELWRSVEAAAELALRDAGARPDELRALGITNQRETTVLWSRLTGRPVAPAIVWQDRRTAERCRELPAGLLRERTGLVPDPYFSATKLEWLLARASEQPAELAFGTVDSWLVWNLTGGDVHATDATNASRTLLYDIAARDWSDELLELFGIDRSVLPTLTSSIGVVGEGRLLGVSVPVAGLAGDQQAALFGQGCFSPGEAKATFGTGSFVLVNVGDSPEPPPDGLLKTVAARGFALEGAVLSSGAAVQWLRDGLGLVAHAAETESVARAAGSSGGVVFVPALTGLGSPHWDPDARGLIAGITRGTTRAQLVRATLEAIAFQVADVLEAFPETVAVLRADGGASANAFLMQFQADVPGCPVEVAAERETTALGAALLAGIGAGIWRDETEVAPLIRRGAVYEPSLAPDEREGRRAEWRVALSRALVR